MYLCGGEIRVFPVAKCNANYLVQCLPQPLVLGF